MLSSSSSDFITVNEYKELEKFLDTSGQDSWHLIIEKYANKKDVFSQILVERFMVIYNDDTLKLANEVREKNNEISNKSLNSKVYIAPTYETNMICFINEIIYIYLK